MAEALNLGRTAAFVIRHIHPESYIFGVRYAKMSHLVMTIPPGPMIELCG